MKKTKSKGPVKGGTKRKIGRNKKKIKQLRIGLWSIAAIIASLILCFSLPYLFKGQKRESGARVPSGAYCYGIDISHYQSKVNWDSLRVMTDSRRYTTTSTLHAKDIRPVSFAFIKATEGSSMKDKYFRKHWKAAEKSGIRKGAYHFFRSSKDPKLQASLFIKTVGKLKAGDLPPVLDIETIHKGCSKETLNRRALIWLKEVEKYYGTKPIVYSSSYFIRDLLCKEIKDNYPIWVAHYETDRPVWKKWKIWQFSDKAVVYGIDGYVDLNVASTDWLNSL